MRESAVQTKIRKALEKNGWIVVKIILCSKPGWMDLMAFKNEKTVFIETKIPGKRLDPLQQYWRVKLEQEGFIVIKADSLLDIQILINNQHEKQNDKIRRTGGRCKNRLPSGSRHGSKNDGPQDLI